MRKFILDILGVDIEYWNNHTPSNKLEWLAYQDDHNIYGLVMYGIPIAFSLLLLYIAYRCMIWYYELKIKKWEKAHGHILEHNIKVYTEKTGVDPRFSSGILVALVFERRARMKRKKLSWMDDLGIYTIVNGDAVDHDRRVE